MVTAELTFPSLTAVISAVPEPTARATALLLPVELSSATTRLFELTQVTCRSVKVAPVDVNRLAWNESVSPCLSWKVELEYGRIEIESTGSRTTGSRPEPTV